MSQRLNNFRTSAPRLGQAHHLFGQRGVVLIMALIMLVIISMLATFSLRNSSSTERVSGNVRTTQLASQAAEIALRYCEEAVVQINSGTGTLTSLPTIQAYATPPLWNAKDSSGVLTNWDGSASAIPPVFVIPASSVNQSTATTTFHRPPECMVESMQVLGSGGTPTTTSTYVITARGFGPEVGAADTTRSRPVGSEVWMQSTIELE